MANSLFKLKVETEEYDQKIKRAVEGIQHLAEVAHRSAGELTGLDKSEVEFIRNLGDMETKSRSAAGKARELENAYKELTVVFNNLNDAEKADEGGKALAASLETLRQRAQEARSQLDTATQSLRQNGDEGLNAGGILSTLKDKFTINVDAIKLFNIGLTAARGALKVAGDAFFASEANVDEWGRVVDSSKSLYQGFLTAINTGDISGYLGRIDQIVSAARQAYDELDRLGTMKTIQSPQMSSQQAENDRLRQIVQTGRYIAPLDGRNPAVFGGQQLQNGQILTADQIRVFEQRLKEGMDRAVGLVDNEIKQTSRAIEAVYNRQAAELGMSVEEFRRGTSSMAEFDKRIKGADDYNRFEREHTVYADGATFGYRDNTPNPFAQYKGWDVFRVDGQRYNELVQLMVQRDQQISQAYGMQTQAFRTVNRAEGITVRNLMNGGGGGGAGGGGRTTTIKTPKVEDIFPEDSLRGLTRDLQELQKAQQLVTNNDDWRGYEDAIKAVQERIKELKGELSDIDAGNMTSLGKTQAVSIIDMAAGRVKGGRAALGLDDVPTRDDIIARGQARIRASKGVDVSMPTEERNGLEDTQKLVSGLSQVAGGLKQMGIELPDGVDKVLGGMQGLMSVIQGVNSIMQLFTTTTSTAQVTATTANTGMLTANSTALAALTSALYANMAVSAIPFFRGGGIVPHAALGYVVPGNDHSDRTPVMVSSGELILNQAQQGIVVDAIEHGGNGQGGGMADMQPWVDGETIFLGMNNTSKRMGRGEIVTTSTLRRLGLIH